MVYTLERSEVWWQGFRDGFSGRLDGFPTDHHSAYEQGWVMGFYEFRQQQREKGNQDDSRSKPSS